MHSNMHCLLEILNYNCSRVHVSLNFPNSTFFFFFIIKSIPGVSLSVEGEVEEGFKVGVHSVPGKVIRFMQMSFYEFAILWLMGRSDHFTNNLI